MQKSVVIQLQGGLDLITPAIGVPPGKCIAVKNYEVTVRGYRRCDGYEAFDGRPAPSSASYVVLSFDTGTAAISAGDTVTGATSGATGVAIYDATLESGSYGASDAAGFLVLYLASGTFLDDEALQVSAATRALANGAQVPSGAATTELHAAYLSDVKASLRSDIAAVPGAGGIRGIHVYQGDIYAFRNNSGNTKCVMHKATDSGWVEQSFGVTLDFDGGTVAFQEGETVTGGSSSHTATIERVVLMSGDWSSSNAVGYLVLSSASGTFTNNETLTGGTSGGDADADGTTSTIEIAPSGKIRCINHNFYGTSNLERMYAATSTGRAFEWDGSVMAPIRTGLSDVLDKPKFVGVHANHLLLGYDGGAVQFSATGLPLNFNPVDGAGEIGIGEDLTGIVSAASTATVVFAKNSIGYLTGTSSLNFVFDVITLEAGARADSAVMADEPLFLDNQGVRRLSTSQAFGDWKRGTLSRMVQPWIDGKKASGASVVGAQAVRNKDQYRLYFDDSDVLVVYLGRKDPEITSLTLGFTPTCVARGEDAAENEILFCGSDDGWVYRMDSDTAFNGGSIESYIRFPWQHQGDPNMQKRYHALRIELDSGDSETTLSAAVEYTYGDDELTPRPEDESLIPGSGGIWDVSRWDGFFWDAKVQSTLSVDLDGIGDNMSYAILSDQADEAPHTLSSATINFSQRRKKRR